MSLTSHSSSVTSRFFIASRRVFMASRSALRRDLRRLHGAPALERAADLEEFADAMRLGLDQLDQRPVDRLARLLRHHERAGAVAHLDQADQLGAVERLADGLPAGIEHRRQVRARPAACRRPRKRPARMNSAIWSNTVVGFASALERSKSRQRIAARRGHGQPFTPPAPQPATRYFWMNTKTPATGAITRRPAAMIIPQSTTLAL